MNLSPVLWKKHLHGQKKYHAFSFLKDGRVMKKETTDELIDGINYLIYQLIKDRQGSTVLTKLAMQKEKGIEQLNKLYRAQIAEIPKMSNRSENKVIRAIARMRDLIADLSK